MNWRATQLRVARLIFRLFKPLLKWTKKKYDHYKQFLPDMTYHTWALRNEEECFIPEDIKNGALISIIVPTFNTTQSHLLEMVYSVVNQHYAKWELILVNTSSDLDRKEAVRNCQGIDSRIRVVEIENKGIAGNTNAGIAEAKGEYIAFLDHDDKLHSCALHCVADAIDDQNPGLIYTDEDKISHDSGLFFEPHTKPRWSPDLLRNVNYINHLSVIKTSHVKEVDGLRPAFDGAQDYDLLLRVIDECKPLINHIPRVLYHWRAAQTSTARDISTKKYIFDAGTKAVQEHLRRNHIPARVKHIDGKPGFYQVHYESPKKIAIVIGPVELRRQRVCVWWLEKLLKKTGTENIEMIVGDWYKEHLDKLDKKPKVTWIEPGGNYWEQASKAIKAEIVICFQDMVVPQDQNALTDLAGAALHSGSVAVSPIIIAPDKTILDAGYVEADFGLQRLFRGYKLPKGTYFGSTEWTRNVMGLSMSIFAVNRKIFNDLAKKAEGAPINTFILHKVYSSQVSNNPMCLLWTHTPFIYKGILHSTEDEDIYFNTNLTQASADIHMHASTWGKWDERATE